jgi:Tfp pilus assembly protein PilN
MIEINLLSGNVKVEATEKKQKPQLNYLLFLLPVALSMLIFFQIYLVFVAVFDSYQYRLWNNKWQQLAPERLAVEKFRQEYLSAPADSKIIEGLMLSNISWSEKLNKISLGLPSGVWLRQISVEPKGFILEGSIISLQHGEMDLARQFIDYLKSDPSFFRGFESLKLNSMQRKRIGGYDIADFTLEGLFKTKEISQRQ